MMKSNEEFKQLQIQKEEKAKQFEADIQKLINDQQAKINEKDREHVRMMDAVKEEIDKLNQDIEWLQKKHEEIMELISKDAKDEIEIIEKKNQHDIAKIQDLSLKSKADL